MPRHLETSDDDHLDTSARSDYAAPVAHLGIEPRIDDDQLIDMAELTLCTQRFGIGALAPRRTERRIRR
jgi:hypothetical protein